MGLAGAAHALLRALFGCGLGPMAGRGALGGGELGASLLALIPAILGMLLGQWLRQRISAPLFKRVFFIGLGLLGGHLLISG